MGITIENVSKAFGAYPAINNVKFEIPKGNFVALLGPSGSGKTTLLRLIAGLERLDSGRILYNGVDYSNKNVKERKVGFVFQHYALFKHMTVFENVAFGLRVKPRLFRPSKLEIKEKVYSLLKFVQLEHLADRYPSQLSGGQKQRIALARALAVEPDVLLLDEPFGALDAKVRQELRLWLREIHQKLNITSIFVTHDQEEALEMADTIVVMNHGKVEQIGSPEEVYHQPANAFVYSFLGRVNELDATALLEEKSSLDNKKPTVAYIRPHEIELSKDLKRDNIRSEVIHVHAVGSTVRIQLISLDTNDLFEVEMTSDKYRQLGLLAKGDIVNADFKNIVLFENNPGKGYSKSSRHVEKNMLTATL